MITKYRTIGEILKKRIRPAPQPTRAARALEYKHVGFVDGHAVYELYAVCDDGQARWFVWGERGWVVKE